MVIAATDTVQDVARLIDAEDNEYVISNPKKGSMELQQDLRFISDLVVLIVASAIGGLIFASLGQPVITGEHAKTRRGGHQGQFRVYRA